MTIWKTICDFMHTRVSAMLSIRAPVMLSVVSGPVKNIICNFFGVIMVHLLRGKKAVMISNPAKLAKLSDPPTTETVGTLIELNSDVGCKVEEPKASKCTWCEICESRDHSLGTCPDRDGKVITVCRLCNHLPCKNETHDHKEHHYECVLFCFYCKEIGDHLPELCPDKDSDLGVEDWDSDMDDGDNWDNEDDLSKNTQMAATAA